MLSRELSGTHLEALCISGRFRCPGAERGYGDKKQLQPMRRTGRRSYSFSAENVRGSRRSVVEGDSPKVMR